MPKTRRAQGAAAGKAQAGGMAVRQASPLGHASVQNDVVGVVLAVLAIALLVSLVSPTSAIVTHGIERALTLCFGVGAVLCPITLFLFSLTFFVEGEEPLGNRAAAGLVLISVAILSLISLFVPGAEEAPALVLDKIVLRDAGGYVGGGVAWALLTFVGRPVGLVLLIGLAVLGVIICGFSISGFVVRLKEGAIRMGEVREAAREERQAYRDARSTLRPAPAAGPSLFGEAPQAVANAAGAVAEAATSFIGDRKTSVLTRRRKRPATRAYNQELPFDEDPTDEPSFHEDEPSASSAEKGEPKTTLLRPRRTARRKPAAGAPAADADVIVPDFLKNPASAADGACRQGARTDRGSSRGSAAARRGSPARGSGEASAPASATRSTLRPKEGGARTRAAKPVAGTNAEATTRAAATSAGTAGAKASRRPATRTAPRPAQAQGTPADSLPKTRKARPKAKAVHTPARPGDGAEGYELPPLSMLGSNPNAHGTASSREELEETMERLQGTLREFGLTSRVVDYVSGPIVTTFRVEMGEGERVSRIRNLEDDIALTLAAEKVRIFAPIPGTSFVGIEIPNRARENVFLGDVLPNASGGPLEVAIGRDSAGRPVIADIAKMPHMLVAGTTGSGKSVMINSMIMSLLMRTTPKQVRLIMIDPKRVEFSCYNGLPHLYVPVVTEPRQAASALAWAVSEMERRLRVFERAGAREIKVYNQMCTTGKLSEMDNPPEPMPYLVVIIDELSDLMMVAGKDVEASIVRIAQLARAAGIHLLIATQRPSANVVTGLIKSNIDNRVALKVSSGIDSRVILDEAGAERLLGNGDMLFKYRGLNMQRVLGCYTSDEEINEVVDFIRAQAEPDYHEEILTAVVPGQPAAGGRAAMDDEDADDPLVWEAAQIVVESQLGSTSGLQRRLKVGYARAGRIMDMLEAKGVVGPPDGSKPREVLLDADGLEELRVSDAAFRDV